MVGHLARLSFVALGGALALASLVGCSGSPTDPLGLGGCLEGDRGTIASASATPPATRSSSRASSSADPPASRSSTASSPSTTRPAAPPSCSTTGGRAAFDGVDLDQQAIDPDAAAYVGSPTAHREAETAKAHRG